MILLLLLLLLLVVVHDLCLKDAPFVVGTRDELAGSVLGQQLGQTAVGSHVELVLQKVFEIHLISQQVMKMPVAQILN